MDLLQQSSFDDCAPSPSPLSSLSGDERPEQFREHPYPDDLIKSQCQLILDQTASIDELKEAIVRSKELILATNEWSYERKWLVRHLVELRFRMRELEDVANDPNDTLTNAKIIRGHHFISRQLKSYPLVVHRQFCDCCSGIIWSVIQASYICSDCMFCVHHKCIENVIRDCAHVKVSESTYPIDDICPEIGLSHQSYRCAECQTSLASKDSNVEPRLCDYTGLYYCSNCHWNDTTVIPARVIHNWDFSTRKVGRASLQELRLTYERPVINMMEKNPKLFVYVQNLSTTRKIRENLKQMLKYLIVCRIAISEKLLDNQIST